MDFDGFLRQVGRNVKLARVRSGLKQIDVHQTGKLTYRHYQNIEAGRVNVTLETLHRLSVLYGVPVADLVSDIPTEGNIVPVRRKRQEIQSE